MRRRQRVLVAPLRLHLNSRRLRSLHLQNLLQPLTDVHVDKPVQHEASSDEAVDVEEENRNEDPVEQLIAYKVISLINEQKPANPGQSPNSVPNRNK